MADEPTGTIEDFLLENRTFPPPADFKEASLVAGTFLYDEADRRLPGLLGPPGRRARSTGPRTGTRSASGSCRSPSGSSAAS